MRAVAAAILALAIAEPAAGQLVRAPNLAPTVTGRTSLRCVVDSIDARRLFVTNTTSATIAAETRIYIDAVHFENAQHEVVFVYADTLAPGQVQDIPLWRSTSCTAWLDTPAMMAPP